MALRVSQRTLDVLPEISSWFAEELDGSRVAIYRARTGLGRNSKGLVVFEWRGVR